MTTKTKDSPTRAEYTALAKAIRDGAETLPPPFDNMRRCPNCGTTVQATDELAAALKDDPYLSSECRSCHWFGQMIRFTRDDPDPEADDGGWPNWTRIGDVIVDAGCIIISDPCYVLPSGEFEGFEGRPGLDYLHATGMDNAVHGEHLPGAKRATWLNIPGNGDPTDRANRAHAGDITAYGLPDTPGAFIVPTGIGDGHYPIYIQRDREDDTMGVTALYIDFTYYGNGPT